ncbi:MAG: DapH/DapD/GlmU-related protein [Flavobacteriaceae bacterium]
MRLTDLIQDCYLEMPFLEKLGKPWNIIAHLESIIASRIAALSIDEYQIHDYIAVHKTALVEDGAVLNPHVIIGKNCTVKAGAYLRNGVYLSHNVSIGANCEIKQSIIFSESRAAHLNYVGNSIIGSDVNLEAGAVAANHFNEYHDRTIKLNYQGMIIDTHCLKFGAIIGDRSRIGANSVLNPGTVLAQNTIVGRLVHIDQMRDQKEL